MLRPVYFDSNIFIYVLSEKGPQSTKAGALLGAISEAAPGLSSVITYGEVLRPPAQSSSNQVATTFLDSLSGLRFAVVDETIAKRAGQLRLEHGLRLPDSLHVATALAYKAELFVTNDLPLAKKIKTLLPVKTLA